MKYYKAAVLVRSLGLKFVLIIKILFIRSIRGLIYFYIYICSTVCVLLMYL